MYRILDGFHLIGKYSCKALWKSLLGVCPAPSQVHQLLGNACLSMQLMQECQAFCVVVSQGAEDKLTTLRVYCDDWFVPSTGINRDISMHDARLEILDITTVTTIKVNEDELLSHPL
ncbi:hypothetical protein DV515_00009597 [Chloebia gouldiae]|uniref:Uncharacterized protein n=1 Tax=Chloebia gouldiae TaxID=44316 RepID=A0A3L8SCH1_CHLGU|nr:hypothetical protein DV515_00009597 [Chloebia gouldiae]